MSKDWTNQLRDRLADYQEPVQDDLWAAIEQSLAQKEKTTAHTVLLRRLSMAAAIAALAVGGTFVYLHPWGGVSENQVASVFEGAQGNGGQSGTPKSTDNDVAAEVSNAKKDYCSLTKTDERNASEPLAVLSDAATIKDESATIKDESVEVTLGSSYPEQQKPQEKTEKTVSKPHHFENLEKSLYEESSLQDHRKKEHRSVALNVYGENGFVSGNSNGNNSSFLMQSDAMVPMNSAGNSEGVPVFDSKVVGLLSAQNYQQKAKHHQPISVGVQVGIPLNSRLSLTTGVVYTKVSSDFIVSAHQTEMVTTQNLHYVGIPLNLNYEVWGTQKFHTYVTLGGEGDVNVKNDTKSEGVKEDSKKDRMQWSGKASVGAQFDVLPELGIYVEPGAKYYFDNGSSIENTFKDKKLNFNFQFGLRWNLGK